MDKRPIGIFDSGLGGLTVLKEVRKALPKEDIVYLGDTARVPYGTRSKKTIEKFSLQCAYFLAGKGVKCIVVACNTSSSNALSVLKKQIKIPIFDVLGSSIESLESYKNIKRVGVIGTSATIKSHLHKILAEKKGYKIVFERACPLFVPLVENGEVNSKITGMVSEKYLSEHKAKVDALIMACTHFPVLRKNIQRSIGKNVVLIDPAVKLAKEIKIYLNKNNINTDKAEGEIEYHVTDFSPAFEETAKVFLGENIFSDVKRAILD